MLSHSSVTFTHNLLEILPFGQKLLEHLNIFGPNETFSPEGSELLEG